MSQEPLIPPAPRRRLALIGANGMLAQAVRLAAAPHFAVTGFDLPELDITDRDQVLRTLTDATPAVIVNCAAFTDVDACESHEALATRVNGQGPGHLAEAARETGATLVHLSTDYVFDGSQTSPYREDDTPAPRSAYGRSKLAGEQAIYSSGLRQHLIVRTSWLFGPGGKNFVETMTRLAREREELRVVADQVGRPTFTADLAQAIMNLLSLAPRLPATAHASPAYGLYHFANTGACSWHQFAEAIVAELRGREPLKVQAVRPIATAEYPLPAPRPAYSVLATEKYCAATGHTPPPWPSALERYFVSRQS